MRSRASNPGNLQVNRVRWFRHYPKWPLIWLSSLVIFVLLACLMHWSLWIPAVLLLTMNWLYWQRVRDHFKHGCANLAIVVSVDPMLIAVATDLTQGDGSYPVIKIIDKSLPTVCGQVPKEGMRLPVVSLYEPSFDNNVPHWADFHPRPVECATGSFDTVQSVMSTFSEDDWDALESGLAQVPRPYRCGLFHIRIAE